MIAYYVTMLDYCPDDLSFIPDLLATGLVLFGVSHCLSLSLSQPEA